VEHIGSTAVPGLAAKPVIDIMIGLADFSIADSLVPRIAALGYEYDSSFEHVFPHRRFFRKVAGGAATHHLHVVAEGGDFWERHVLFRDHLRTHAETRRRYAALKRELARAEWESGAAYSEAKTAFIRDAESRARGADPS
jgi:GrpB-like predicted nucleotidyltransferase (UPF0157 family)